MLTVKSFTNNPFQENTYILYNENKDAIIIDPGMYDTKEFADFFEFIDAEKLNPILLLNTHTHLDHLFGNAAVLKKFSIPFAFHKSDKPIFDSAFEAGKMYNISFEQSPQPDYYISENDLIKIGDDELKILFTPGHSPGSVCFYNELQNFIISGDVLFYLSVGRSDFPGGNADTLMNSIQNKLFALPDNVAVYSGHGPITHIGFEKMNNPFVTSS